jgi:hypothetical protein
MKPQRLRAPAQDGALLAKPPLGAATDRLLAANLGRLAAWDYDFQGRRAPTLRAMARHQIRAAAHTFLTRFGLEPPNAPHSAPGTPHANEPLIVTGHQPELFHPGVWVKNFAVAALARSHQGIGLNLIVDNDIPKGSAIRVPELAGQTLRTRLVDFDEWAGEVPYEDWSVRDEERFTRFGDRVRQALGPLVPDPLIDDFWPWALQFQKRTDHPGTRFALARHALESSWGVRNAEVPVSAVCETEAFLWFAAHLLAHAARFRPVHNTALRRYRALYGIRSRHHPVPELGAEGDWHEAPFWVWRAQNPRRRPLLARQQARTMELRIAGEAEPFLEIPLAPDREACCAVEQLNLLPTQGIRLRTRALTTTLFARLVLGDLFIHGIGGAKYDELGDEIIRGFFGVEPPPFLTLSMTLWLGLPLDPATPNQLHDVERALRDLTYNPDRHLPESAAADPRVQSWVAAKRHALAAPQATRRQRVARFRELRRCNQALQPAIAAARAELADRKMKIENGLRHNAIARSREFAFVLHSRERLREAMARAAPGAFGASMAEKIAIVPR